MTSRRLPAPPARLLLQRLGADMQRTWLWSALALIGLVLLAGPARATEPIAQGSAEWRNVEQAVDFLKTIPGAGRFKTDGDYILQRLKSGKIDVGEDNETSAITGQTTISASSIRYNANAASRKKVFDPTTDLGFQAIVSLAGTLYHEMAHTHDSLILHNGGVIEKSLGGVATYEWAAWVKTLSAYRDWMNAYIDQYNEDPAKNGDALRKAAILAATLDSYAAQFTGESASEHNYDTGPWRPFAQAARMINDQLQTARKAGAGKPLPQTVGNLRQILNRAYENALEANVSSADMGGAKGDQALAQADRSHMDLPPTDSAVLAAAAPSAMEVAVVAAINAARADPQGYAARLRRGAHGAAANDAIAFLERQAPLAALASSAQLGAAADFAAADLGAHGLTGHVASDGSNATQRMQRNGVYASVYAEEISLAQATADDVVRQLIIDADTPSRAHRNDLFGRLFAYIGVGCGPHKVYRTLCVIDLTSAILAR